MCRNIKPLFYFSPKASDQEIKDASLQFVRKLSGFSKPSKVNEVAFNNAVEKIAEDAKALLDSLNTDAKPRDREIENQKAKERSLKRFQK